MGANEIRVGDIGTHIAGTISDDDGIVDLSTCLTKQIIILRPDGTYLQEDVEFETDGTDGKLRYIIKDGDLVICGKHRIQWLVSFSSGIWQTDIKTFKVYSNLI